MSAHEGTTSRTARWATLTPEALTDEIEQNRRSERWLTVATVAAAVLTVAVLLVVAAAR